jgi:hypothetical protein
MVAEMEYSLTTVSLIAETPDSPSRRALKSASMPARSVRVRLAEIAEIFPTQVIAHDISS